MRYRLKTAISIQTERMARLEEEADCFVLLTNVPTAGPLAHSARDILTVYKEQHGTEQNHGFLKDPVIVNSLFLKKPERIEALGLVLLLALLLWRLMERAMRTHVDSTSTPLLGWDKKVTERPTTCFTLPAGSQRIAMTARRLSRRHKRILHWLAADYQRTRGMITSSHQDLVPALPRDKRNIRHSLQTLEARGLIIISRSPGGKAESLWFTPERQKWASQLTGSCN
jgi:hypothetical protein